MKTKTMKLNISFDFQCDVEATDDNDAFKKASDAAMDYFEKILCDSHKFDEFWEYQVKIIKTEN